MKKKVIVIASVCVSLITAFTIFLCCCSIDSCFYSKLTMEKVRRNLSEWYNITLPENVKMEGYASDISPSDGEYFAVLGYDGQDEEFNSIFSYEEDTENVKSYFSENHIERMHDISKNFLIPDLSENKYGWIMLYRKDVDSDYANSTLNDYCIMLYFIELNKIAIHILDY